MFRRINVWRPEERSQINSLKIFHLEIPPSFPSAPSYTAYSSFEFETDRQTEVRKLAHVVAHVACASLALAAMFGLRAHSEKCGPFYPRLVHHPSSSKCSFEMLERAGVHGLPSTISSRPRERRRLLRRISVSHWLPLLFSFPTFKNKLTNFVLRQLLRT